MRVHSDDPTVTYILSYLQTWQWADAVRKCDKMNMSISKELLYELISNQEHEYKVSLRVDVDALVNLSDEQFEEYVKANGGEC